MKKKTLVEIIGAVLIGLVFLSSYSAIGSIGGGSGGSSTSVTTSIPNTVYAYGFANASILNYSQNLIVNVSCAQNTSNVLNYVDNIVSNLQDNNSITNSYEVGSKILVESGRLDSRSFYSYVGSMLNESSRLCTGFQGTAQVSLPATVNLTVASGQKPQVVPIQLNSTEQLYSLPLSLAYNSSTIRLKILGLLTYSGAIYQLNVSTVT